MTLYVIQVHDDVTTLDPTRFSNIYAHDPKEAARRWLNDAIECHTFPPSQATFHVIVAEDNPDNIPDHSGLPKRFLEFTLPRPSLLN